MGKSSRRGKRGEDSQARRLTESPIIRSPVRRTRRLAGDSVAGEAVRGRRRHRSPLSRRRCPVPSRQDQSPRVRPPVSVAGGWERYERANGSVVCLSCWLCPSFHALGQLGLIIKIWAEMYWYAWAYRGIPLAPPMPSPPPRTR
jgi:hypothetical protein